MMPCNDQYSTINNYQNPLFNSMSWYMLNVFAREADVVVVVMVVEANWNKYMCLPSLVHDAEIGLYRIFHLIWKKTSFVSLRGIHLRESHYTASHIC